MSSKSKLEYIWLDGYKPTQSLRSKTRIERDFGGTLEECPMWSFDGSSTEQADGSSSDCLLKPVAIFPDPGRLNSYLVMTEVLNADGTPHVSNGRATIDDDDDDFWFGFEQEYTLFDNGWPLGWPKDDEPAPQGDYYCGRNIGESISREHLNACIDAGLSICGTNAEVMLGQWEYQIGAGRAVDMSDDLWVARWLLERICEKHGLSVSLYAKPIEGDWNGAGCHTNFSTKEMRQDGGYDKIIEACERLSKNPQEHIDAYGIDNDKRLTGLHETCDINTFRYGVSDRGASIRIPWQVEKNGKGYLEDRRPASNCDPYVVSQKLIQTICH